MASKAVNSLLKLKQKINEVGASDELDFLLEEIPEQVKRRTRLGKDGENNKLKPLTEKYVEQRKRLDLYEQTTPKKSNLTRSGAMLNSIIGKRESDTKFTFAFSDSRSDGKSNNDIAKFAKQKGRDFFKLSESEKKQFMRKISTVLKNAVKKLT